MAGAEAKHETTKACLSRYFIAKCKSFTSLVTAKNTSIWACSDRTQGPQPKEVLSKALKQQPVILVYSVNNCHGWHGYASMLTVPGDGKHLLSSDTVEEEGRQDQTFPLPEGLCSDVRVQQTDKKNWHPFRIKWHKLYLWEHGEQSLPFQATEQLRCLEDTPINKAWNFQEISASTGQQLCSLIDEDYERLVQKRRQREDEKAAAVIPFFKPGAEKDPQIIWQRLLHKVEDMGTVLLACVFGSQRYNLHTPRSDVDMFVVYQAPAAKILGFHPPAQTIKNRDVETCDYTIHEVHRYCELLISGDPRCIETLFLHPSTITHSSEQWLQLCEWKHLFLNSQCLDKYLRDATGSKGTKQLLKWESTGETGQEPLPGKVCKLAYIVLRLLQNACEVADGHMLRVYRELDSPERHLLMNVRHGKLAYSDIQAHMHRLTKEIENRRKNLETKNTGHDVEREVTDWLIKLRYENLHQTMAEKSGLETAELQQPGNSEKQC